MSPLDLWVVAAYLVASLAVGIALARRASGSLEDFFVGGRALPWWLAGTSMAATTFSIDTPLYVAGVVSTRGIAGNWEWWSFGIAHVVLLYVFARLWRRAEVVTDNELSELRYGGRPAALLRGVKGFLFAGIMGPISLGLSMLAMVKVVDALEVLPALGLSGAQDRLWVVVGVSALVLVYAGISGLWGVVVTDFVQFVLGMAGALLVAWAAVSHVGGLGELVAAAGRVEGTDLLSFTPLTIESGGRLVWSSLAGISASTFLAYVGLQWWAFRRSDGGGEFVQRLAAARTEAEAQKAAWLFNLLHYVVRTWPWILVALAAVVLYPDLEDPELGYPRLMLDFLPAGVLGLVVASLVAAFMSTVSTIINWSASYLTHDLYVRFARPEASTRERVVAARVASVVVTALGAAAAFHSESVTTLFRLIIAVGTGPGLVLILRWFWWRVNAWGELAAMVAGFLVGLGTSVVPVLTIPDFGLRLLVTAGITTAVWVPVMLLTPPEKPERLDAFYRKVRPGGPGWGEQRRRTGLSPDAPLSTDLARVGAGLLVLFGAMFAVGGAVLLRPGTAAASVGAVVVGGLVLRRLGRGGAAAAAVVLLVVVAGGSPAAAQVVEPAPGEGAGRPLSAWLAGRFPGLLVLGSSGTPGSAPRLRIRGPGSLSLSNEPVVILDGVRIDAGPRSTALGVGGQAPTRLDDIPVAALARVEVVRGPAAVRWGAGAGAGVVLLTSRAAAVGGGGEGVRAWLSAGGIDDTARRPDNWFGREGTGACFAFEVALGRCVQTELQRFGPLSDPAATPFRSGATASLGARVSRRMGEVDVGVGVSHDAEDGVLGLPPFDRDALVAGADGDRRRLGPGRFTPSGVRRSALDLGVRTAWGDGGEARAWLLLSEGRVRRPFDGNDFAGLHAAGLLGTAEGGPETRYGYRLFTPSQVYARQVRQEWRRWTGGVSAEARVRPWLAVRGGVSLDRIDRHDLQSVPPGVVNLGPDLPRGIADDARAVTDALGVRLGFELPWTTAAGAAGTTALTADLWTSDVDRLDLNGVGLPEGGGPVGAAESVDTLDLGVRRRIAGLTLVQHLSWGPGLDAEAGVRLEAQRVLGRSLEGAALPFVGLRLRPGEAGPVSSWWPRGMGLRASWGRSVAAPVEDGRDLDRVLLLADAPTPPLERTSTWEAGADLEALGGRVVLSATRYVRTTRDLLLRTPLLYSAAAAGARYDAVGSVENRGWELAAGAELVRGGGWHWSVEAAAAFHRNEVLAVDRPDTLRQGVQWSVPGYPLGGYWDRPLRWEDRDGDGILVPAEINVQPDARYLGSPHPAREVVLGSRLGRGPVTVFGRLLHRGGHRLRNLTEGYRCQATLCRGFNDPTAPLADQARAQAVAIFPPDFFTEAGFIEDASYWRLQEAGVTWRVPAHWSGGSEARLTLVGYGLALWTDYSGMDPEVNQFGAVEVLARDFMTQPPLRRWSLRLDVTAPWW